MKSVIFGLCLTTIAFALASTGYWVLAAIQSDVFGTLYRMIMYHVEHPYQYIGIVSVVFGFVGGAWHHRCRMFKGLLRWVSITATILLTIIAASVPGGMLWAIHDMEAGFYPQGRRPLATVFWGAKTGLLVGWQVILVSIPYNFIGFIAGALTLHWLPDALSKFPRAREG